MAFLTDGYQTIVGFSALSGAFNSALKEKEVQPPSVDGGGMVDTTTMVNNRWRTRQPKRLMTLDDMKLQVSYDPIIYSLVVGNINKNGIIIVNFPDGSTLAFWGWVDKMVPQALKEGEFPLAELTIHCGNQDNSNNEQAPVYAATGGVVNPVYPH
jgi:hypothetical protein